MYSALLAAAIGVATVRPSVLPIRAPALTKLPLFNPPSAPPTAAVRLDQTAERTLVARVGDAEFEVLRSVSELLVPSHTGGGGQFFALRGRRVRDRADLRLTAGELSCERLLAGARTKRWWMGPAFGAGAADLPAETQFCLVRLADDAYAVLLPLVSGHHRCTLRAARSGSKEGVDLDVASGDPSARTGEALDNALYVAAGADPFALLDDAFAAVSERLGTFDVARRKQTPADLDWFGWCTWDAFYQAVDPKGVTAGLRSLAAAGTPARVLILDDGWQTVADDKTPSRNGGNGGSSAADGAAAGQPEECAIADWSEQCTDAESAALQVRRPPMPPPPPPPPPPQPSPPPLQPRSRSRPPFPLPAQNEPRQAVEDAGWLAEAVGSLYNNHIDGADKDTLRVRLWRLAFTSPLLLRSQMQQFFNENTQVRVAPPPPPRNSGRAQLGARFGLQFSEPPSPSPFSSRSVSPPSAPMQSSSSPRKGAPSPRR